MSEKLSEYRGLSRREETPPVRIHDASGIILFSAELTRMVIEAVGRALRSAVVQGVIEVVLTINQVVAEVELVTFRSRIHRRLNKFHALVVLCSREFERAEASCCSPQFKQEWIRSIEQVFYQELANLD